MVIVLWLCQRWFSLTRQTGFASDSLQPVFAIKDSQTRTARTLDTECENLVTRSFKLLLTYASWSMRDVLVPQAFRTYLYCCFTSWPPMCSTSRQHAMTHSRLLVMRAVRSASSQRTTAHTGAALCRWRICVRRHKKVPRCNFLYWHQDFIWLKFIAHLLAILSFKRNREKNYST